MTLDEITTWLCSRERRATYGAVANFLGKTPRELMGGHPPRNQLYSWIVAATTRCDPCFRPDGTPFEKARSKAGWPTGYKYHNIDKKCALQAREGTANVIKSGEELRQWLHDRIAICSRIKHRGMRLRYELGDDSMIRGDMRQKVAEFLLKLDSATTLQDFHQIHPLTGRKGVWSMKVTGNWRITFRYNSHAYDITLEDYHEGH